MRTEAVATRSRRRGSAVIGVIAGFALLVAACGSDGGSDSDAPADTLALHLDHWAGYLEWGEAGTPFPLARRALDVLRRERPPEPTTILVSPRA